MSETVMTFSGKAGDALHQWPVAWWWAKKTGQKFTCWLEEQTCKLVAPLFASQACVEKVEFKPGIENWNMGGQPWHFNLPTSEYENRTVYHLGLRSFPARPLTLEAFAQAKVPVTVSHEELAHTPVFHVEPMPCGVREIPGSAEAPRPLGRCVLHGQPICIHTKSTPGFWKFLASIARQLDDDFNEIVWVGSSRDREIGLRTYPQWHQFDDQGDFLKLAQLMAGADLVIGTGSSVASLAGALKIPCVRVHDPIGDHPKRIWDNLAHNSINDTEAELRKTWPELRATFRRPKSVAEVVG